MSGQPVDEVDVLRRLDEEGPVMSAFAWKWLATKDRTSWKARLIRDLYRYLYSADQPEGAK